MSWGRWLCSVGVFLFFGCATIRRPADENPVVDVTAPTAQAEFGLLQSRRSVFPGERMLMHIRLTSHGMTNSFKAQLQIDSGDRMRLDAFTPIGTTAFTLYASENRVVFLNGLDQSSWVGDAADFARAFGLFGPLKPVEMGMLLLGLPAQRGTAARMISANTFGTSPGVVYTASPTGLQRASVESDHDGVVLSYMPPSQPPVHITVEHKEDRLEIDVLESGSSREIVAEPGIPDGWKQGRVPRL